MRSLFARDLGEPSQGLVAGGAWVWVGWCLPRMHWIALLYPETSLPWPSKLWSRTEGQQSWGSGSKKVAVKDTILQSSMCLQRRKHYHFTKLSCKLQSHFSDRNGNISKTAQSRSLVLYTWAAQTLFPGSSIKQWEEREGFILLCEPVRPWARL